MELKVTHIDCNGKVIPDLSKVVLPLDLSIEIYDIYLRAAARKLEREEAEESKRLEE